MKIIHATFIVLLAAAAAAGCSAPAVDEPAPAGGPQTASPDDPGEETGTTDFSDDTGDATEPSFPVGAAAEFHDDSPDAMGEIELPATPEDTAIAHRPGLAPPGYVDKALRSPNTFFKRQVRHPKWNPTGPLVSGNCGPTSLAMAAKVFGKEPAGLTIEQSIDRVRKLMDKPSDSGGASSAQVRLGAQRLGLNVRAMLKGDLDLELAKKHVVVLMGYPGLDGTSNASVYQHAFRAAGYNYTFDEFHSIAVLGKTTAGRYVVGDPLSKIGFITLTAAQMHDYWKRWGGSGTAVWR